MPTRDKLVTPADQLNPLLTAADVMTAAPRTCSKFSTVLEAVMVFRAEDTGLVAVVDGGKPIGVVTDRDIALALADHEGVLPGMAVGEVMKRDIATVAADAKLGAVSQAFAEHRVRRVLVVDETERLLGVISWGDLAPHMSKRALGSLAHRVIEGS
jgi:CBS domain-containing protein